MTEKFACIAWFARSTADSTSTPELSRRSSEGGAIFGASAALFQELTFENGRLQQTNFNTFPVMRIE